MRLQALLYQLPPLEQLSPAVSTASGVSSIFLQYIALCSHSDEIFLCSSSSLRLSIISCHIDPAKVHADCRRHSWTSAMFLS